jgi:prophage regulatory protein
MLRSSESYKNTWHGEDSKSTASIGDVQRRVPFSRSTIYLMISRGEFPKQISLGARAVGWLRSEIDQWIESRVAARHEERSA